MNKMPFVVLATAAALAACRQAAPANPDVSAAGAAVEQRTMGSKPPVEIVASFDGLGDGFTGPQGSFGGRNPSDNTLAVGPDHVFQIVNVQMAIFTKTGKPLYGPVPTNTLFKGFGGACESDDNGDAVVRYDQLAQRWLVVMPIFREMKRRPDQPPIWTASHHAYLSPPGVKNQPGPAARLFVPPLAPPPSMTPGASPGSKQTPRRRFEFHEPKPEDLGPWAMCYAVSTSPDPFGTWYRYEFLRPLFPDYPRPAVWPDGWYVPSSTGDTVIQKHTCVADRARMLEGKSASEQCFVVDNVSFLNNADLDGTALPPAGAPNPVLAAGGTQLRGIFSDDGIYAWQFHVDWADPAKSTLTGPAKISVAPYQFLCDGQLTSCVRQPGTDRHLDAQGDKLMARLVYRNVNGKEELVVTHSVEASDRQGGVRWYEFTIASDRSVHLAQQGTYAPDLFDRWMASAAIDHAGNIGIGYSYGGNGAFPGQRFAGRLAADPAGVLTLKEAALAEGEGSQKNTLRWEDYTQTAVDPSDDCTIWYVGDYYKKGAENYSTRIGAFRMPGCR
ncbi:MAG TPA: hypothetical protein VFD85_07485 [Gemmatimonadales bacterium]|nr:hypothetical protein [Gemmatimonadales bacterium]